MTDIMKLAKAWVKAGVSPNAHVYENARAALQSAIEALQAECAEHKENAMRNARIAVSIRVERDQLQSQLDAMGKGEPVAHDSDCALHDGPAYPAGPCDCGQSKAPKPSRIAFEHHWFKTRGGKKSRHELERHPKQPDTYVADSANRHWVTWQAARATLISDNAAPKALAPVAQFFVDAIAADRIEYEDWPERSFGAFVRMKNHLKGTP